MDFEADVPAAQPSDEAAGDYYSKISPGAGAAIGSQIDDGALTSMFRGVERSGFADYRGIGSGLPSLGASVAEAYTPGQSDAAPVSEPLLPAAEVNKRFGPLGDDGKQVSITNKPMSEGLAQIIAGQKKASMAREAVWSRYAGQNNIVTNFATGTAGFLLDPLNLGSMFVPGVGEEAILSRLGTGVASRLSARALAGASAGAMQQGALSAFKVAMDREEAGDYDMRSALKDIAFGAALGAAGHAGFGALREAGILKPDHLMTAHGTVEAAIPPVAPAVDVPPVEVEAVTGAALAQREAAMKAGVAQVVEGRPVDVQAMFPEMEAPAVRPATGPARVFFGSQSIEVRHELAEAADLVTSHTSDFAVNPVFPPELQPRDRAAVPARNQVNGIAANLQPERLGPSPEANFGAPIVGPDNVVESGNGRTMAIRQAYAAAGDRAEAYRSFLDQSGYDTAGFREPVLVARRLTEMAPDERASFAHMTAASEAQRLGTTETALSDARAITPDVSQHLQAGDIASAGNRDFVRAFVAKMPAGEAAGMMAGDGQLSASGVTRLRAAITARAYGDESVIARAFESQDSNIKSIATALTDSAAAWIKMREAVERGEIASADDVTAPVMQAVQKIMLARDTGEKMSDAFRQVDMFAQDLPSKVTRFFFKGEDYARFYSAPAMADNLATYARDLVEGAQRGEDMFGNAAPGAADVLGGLIQRNAARAEPPPTLADLAQQQITLDRTGYAPGIPQAEHAATMERVYGPKDDVSPEPEPQPTTDANGVTRDPEMEAIEQRVRVSPNLTDLDRAALDVADADVRIAAAKADAYELAGEMLTQGEKLSEPVTADRVGRLADEASQDVFASMRRADGASVGNETNKPGLAVRNDRTGAIVQAQDAAGLKEMLERHSIAADQSVDQLQRASEMVIGDRLKKLIGDIPVYTVGPAEMRALGEGRVRMQAGYEPAGFYDPRAGHIVALDDALRNPVEASRLMLHEGLHAFTFDAIEKSPAARQLVDMIRDTALAHHFERGGEMADHYGLSSPHEFVSEGFSNPEFQRFLASIPADSRMVEAFGLDQAPGRSLWDVFVGAVRKLLGMAPDQHTLLDATMRLGQRLEEERASLADGGGDGSVLPSRMAAAAPPNPISRIERAVAERGSLGPGEARTLIREVADRAEQMRQTGEADPYVAAARELADKIKDNARKDKLDALRNADIRTKIMGEIKDAGGMAGAPERLRSMLHGTYSSGLDSVQSQFRGLSSTWQAALSSKLKALGIEKAVVHGELDEDIAKDLWSMNAGGGEGSGNALARQAAEAIHPILDEIKERLNGLGARIGDATDYVSATRHDPYKMRRAAGSSRASPDEAFAAWWSHTQPLLAEKTFDDLLPREGETQAQARDRFGRNVFDALITGIHMTADGVNGVRFDPEGGGGVGPAFEGTRNLAKKVSHERTLFWQDGAAWNTYVGRFGAQTSLAQGIMLSIMQGAKQVALMERFGTNPMANLNQVERALSEEGRADFEGLKRFQSKMNGVRNVMSYLDGSANIPANALWSSIGNNVRTAYAMFDLGGVGVTHFASIWPTVSSEFRHHGVGRLEGLGALIGGLVRGLPGVRSESETAMLSEIGAYADGLTRDMQAHWTPDSPQMGRMSSVANTFMKYTGIHYVFDNTQAAVRSMLSHNLARNMGKEFADIDPHLRGMLDSYGIGEREWGLLRSVSDLKTENGRAYFTPRDALRINPDLVEQHLRDTGALREAPQAELSLDGENAPPADPHEDQKLAFARSMSDKIGGYLSDSAAHSTVTAGARERAMLLGSAKAGSLTGETMRFLTQFKMWPVAAYDQLLRREVYMSTSRADAAWGLGAIIALSTASGYLRMSVNDKALGHPLRPMDWKTGLAALAQGGGLGILGDFMFGEVNRMGGGLIGTAGGPLVSDADTLIKIFGRFRMDLTDPNSHHKNGTFADLWPDLAHFAVRHIPFNNLVYLKGTLDYLLWYHVFEATNPGWWERTNRRLEKEQGRAMTGYVPGGGVPYGSPGVFMKNRSGQTFGLMGQN